MWYHEFAQYIRTAFPDSGVDFEMDIMPQIRELTVLCFEAARPFLQLPRDSAYESFNLFGFDFMIDEDFKVRPGMCSTAAVGSRGTSSVRSCCVGAGPNSG